VFILHNRIFDIIHLRNKLQLALPGVEIRIGHGQMSSNQLENLMIDFYDNKFPVLIATTIIENGVDIPNAHTMIVNNSEHFGLAQLHQLRGRVGRDQTQSYCYLLYKNKDSFTKEVQDRFEALMEFSALGSGYDIALRDLELRGIGNILGTEQSGYMEAVGLEFYMHVLNEAISREKGIRKKERPYLNISTKMQAYIPEEYIPDMSIRLALYKSIADLKTKQDIDALIKECEDRFGRLPNNLEVMLSLISEELNL
jgi:transcription-repair coupling factor (superfamily II helicase)